jgi:hypothetical protein
VDTCLDDRGGCTPIDEREPVDCYDSVDCTDDSCDVLTGCMNIPNDDHCPLAHYCDPIEGCLMTGCPCYDETTLNNWFVTLSGCEDYDILDCQDNYPYATGFRATCISGEPDRGIWLFTPGRWCDITIDQNLLRTEELTDEQIIMCREILLESNLWNVICP